MQETAVPGLVQRLLTHEAEEAQDPQALLEAADRACEKLRIHLSKRIGQDGFRTLLARALHLATIQFPDLDTVRVAPDGSLQGLREAGNQNASGKAVATGEPDGLGVTATGAVTLITHLLELLVIFIGDELTRRMLSAVWPLTPLLEENEMVGNEMVGTDTNKKSETLGREVETR